MPEWIRPFLVGAGVVALLATTIGMVNQAQRANEAEERVEELEARVQALEAEVDRLETELEDDTGIEVAIGELLGGPTGRMLGEMLSDGELQRLLSGLLDDGDIGGMLDGLLGGRDLDDLLGGRGLDDLLGRGGDGEVEQSGTSTGLFDDGGMFAAAVPGAACLSGAGGGLADLFGGDSEALPDEPGQLVEVVAGHVAELRELDWSSDVEVDFIDGEELRERLDELLDDEPGVDGEQRLLAALGAVPAELDLAELQRDLLDGQVAGYYAPDEDELVVRVPDDGTIRPLDKVTLAHELDHALVDQALGLPDLDDPAQDADATLASLALVEGDATLLMQLWSAQHLSLADQLLGLLSGDLAGAQAQFAAVPHHLQQELLFPYTAGLGYVCDLKQQGGWAAVDEAYETPPATSLEIMQPGVELTPSRPTSLSPPPGGDELLATTFGAAPLQWLFEAPGGAVTQSLDDPRGRAGAWGGDEVRVWELDRQRTVLGFSLVDRGEGPPLCDSVGAWHAAAFPDQQRTSVADTTWTRGTGSEGDTVTALRCADDEVHYVSAPDVPTVVTVLGG